MRNHTTTDDRADIRPNPQPGAHADTGPLTGKAPRRSGRAQPGPRLAVVASAGATALLLWLVAGPVLGINLDVLLTPGATTPVPVAAGSVIISSVAAGLLGWALLAGLERISRHGATIWRCLAGAVALLSLGGPLSLAQSGGGTVVLTLLHLVVGGILLIALPRAGTERAHRTSTGQAGVARAGAPT
ncbi:DUF6069 family protein [Ornithinimicrobium faecis]|uniref:DUF6069 family protein n=1 Tax=Ornithinimicrobium faecis TaxID=2934158 RepID=A0ABY4YVG3_9MICO|nr:DUF6069 family protein [Ornithinimicrobium sp. HY1793]USQ80746.1 DUF6069 family protein [Ornithinimicrobium sp. HY1793]